jgi:pyruvate/2-oxoglutarate dehydrogenase complex dihydrolipoamide dehydrogenase (E3) component
VTREFDLMVLGGGAAGLTAAREGARRGAVTALVQDGPVGGDCTFTGCVPSKTLLAAAARGESFSDAMDRVRRAVARVAATEDDIALKRDGVTVVHGRARLTAPGEIDVDGTPLRCSRVVVATGAGPVVPPIEGLRQADPLTNETVFSLAALPGRLAVLGGGAIGCELAQAFARLGAAVTVVEAEDRLLAREEPEASQVIAEALAADGVRIDTGDTLERVEALGGGPARLHLTSGTDFDVDRVLVAVGRRPAADGLGLEEVGVAIDEQGHVRTDATLATTAKGVWAAGDVTGRLPFTHAAAQMARIAVRNALARPGRRRQRFDPAPVPRVTFTSPEVGRVGMTEAEAAGRGGRVAYLPLDAVDRAIATGETRGFVKLVAGPRRLLGNAGGGRVLGATVVAPTGGELVHEPALAIRTGMFTGRLAQTTHAYPTWSTAIQQAAAQFFMTLDGRTARPARHPDPEETR